MVHKPVPSLDKGGGWVVWVQIQRPLKRKNERNSMNMKTTVGKYRFEKEEGGKMFIGTSGRARPKFGFGVGFGAETDQICRFGWFRPWPKLKMLDSAKFRFRP